MDCRRESHSFLNSQNLINLVCCFLKLHFNQKLAALKKWTNTVYILLSLNQKHLHILNCVESSICVLSRDGHMHLRAKGWPDQALEQDGGVLIGLLGQPVLARHQDLILSSSLALLSICVLSSVCSAKSILSLDPSWSVVMSLTLLSRRLLTEWIDSFLIFLISVSPSGSMPSRARSCLVNISLFTTNSTPPFWKKHRSYRSFGLVKCTPLGIRRAAVWCSFS